MGRRLLNTRGVIGAGLLVLLNLFILTSVFAICLPGFLQRFSFPKPKPPEASILDPLMEVGEAQELSHRLSKLSGDELSEVISQSFPGTVLIQDSQLKIVEPSGRNKREGFQKIYRLALLEYLKRFDNSPVLKQSIIRDYGDLVESGLFQIQNGKLISHQFIQGNNVSAFRVDLTHKGSGLTVSGFNSPTAYFVSPGEEKEPYNLLAHVGMSPFGSQDSEYRDLGCFVAVSQENWSAVLPGTNQPGWESYIPTKDKFARMKPRVFWVHPDFWKRVNEDRENRVRGESNFEKWIKSEGAKN